MSANIGALIPVKIDPITFENGDAILLDHRLHHPGRVRQGDHLGIEGHGIVGSEFLVLIVDDLLLQDVKFLKALDRDGFVEGSEIIKDQDADLGVSTMKFGIMTLSIS